MSYLKAKKIVIIAGEESGDIHAAAFIKQLKADNLDIEMSGIGGHHMQNAGVELISDLARYGVTGLTEVIRHARVIRKAFALIKAHLIKTKPDLLILVDYPGFNLRLAKFAKSQGIRVLYYISPQIWAWKANRIHTIKATVDKMAVILPFEKIIYEKEQVPVAFVGHPLMQKEKIPAQSNSLDLPENKRLVAFLPGSRVNEVERHMPVFIETMKRLSEKDKHLHFIIPVAKSLNLSYIQDFFKTTNLPLSLIEGKATEVAAKADAIVVASGTASLECALLAKPMCIVYKAAWLSYAIAMKVIKVKYLGLSNLLQNAMVVPELLQYDCNPDELVKIVQQLLNDNDLKTKMTYRLADLASLLSDEKADCSMAELVKQELAVIS